MNTSTRPSTKTSTNDEDSNLPGDEDCNQPGDERKMLLERLQALLGDVPPHFWARASCAMYGT